MSECKAYLEITMCIDDVNRAAAAEVYFAWRQPFLDTIPGALTKQLLVREEDVQVLHGFDSVEHAAAYLESDMFKDDVVTGLSPLLKQAPEVRIFSVVG